MCEKNITAQRLESLLISSGLSQEKFADRCGLSLAALKNYIAGKPPRIPNTESLLKICKACSVSADWLLGLSDVSSMSSDIKNACEVTGLSEEAVKILQSVEDGNKYSVSNALSVLIENPLFENMMIEFDYFLDTLESMTIEDLQEFVPYTGADGQIKLGRNATAMFFRNNVVSLINTICSDQYSAVTQKLCGNSFVTYGNGDGRKVVIDKKVFEKIKREDSNE